jgi:SMP-30/gluconolaconase/LRE-like protein
MKKKFVPVVECLLIVASMALAPYLAPAQTRSAATDSASCEAVGDLKFVCGPINVEDFLPVDNGRWLVGGSFKAGSAGLYLIDTKAKTYKTVALSIAARTDPRYSCPAPDLKNLQTHGLDVVPGHDGTTTVYAINHGGRESVEVFRLSASQASAEWVGCVVMPEGANPNSVAVLAEGAFVVTKFMDNHDKEAFQHILAGQSNGVVYLWAPGKGFSEVPGTQLSGDNGLLASHDGKWIYVNAYGTREIYRVPLTGQGDRTSVKVEFNPDNLRWAPDGTILATGQFVNAQNLNSRHGWATVRVDPTTLKVTPVVKEPGYAQFDDATSAVQVGQTLWFGTFRGDRVAYRQAP